MKISLRRTLRLVLVHLLYWTGLLHLAKRQVAKRGIVVLTFHRILPDQSFEQAQSPLGMMVRRSSFESLLEYLRQNCQCVSLDRGSVSAHDSQPHRPRVAITFDDGWKDNYQHAFPLLRKFSVPATIFICPGLAGRTNPFWPEKLVALWRSAQATGKLEDLERLLPETSTGLKMDNVSYTCDSLIENLKTVDATQRDLFLSCLEQGLRAQPQSSEDPDEAALMDWIDMSQMSHHGITFGSHSNTHQLLPQIPNDLARSELIASKNAIEAHFQSCHMLAYPNGDCSESVRAAVAECGYRYAFLNKPGVWNLQTDSLSIPRINIWEGKLTNRKEHFSKANIEYSIFWAAYFRR